MIANCQCQKCSQMLAFEADDVGATVNCPNCGSDTQLVSPSIPQANGEKLGDGEFYVWLDDKAEGPFQSQQLIEMAKQFPEMAWSFAGGSEWNKLLHFQTELEKVRTKERIERNSSKLKSLRLKKKEVQLQKRQISAQMTAWRNQAKEIIVKQGVVVGNSKQAVEQRRRQREVVDNFLSPLQQKMSTADYDLAQIDKEILELEADET